MDILLELEQMTNPELQGTGQEETLSESTEGLQDGDIVECILIGMGYSSHMLRKLEADNVMVEREDAKRGISGEPIHQDATYKSAGVEWYYAVIGKKDKYSDKYDLLIDKDESGELVLPDYHIFGEVSQDPVSEMHKSLGQNKYFNRYASLNQKDMRTWFWPDRLPPYENKPKKENQRLNNWSRVLGQCASLDEQQTLTLYNSLIGRKLMLHDVNESGYYVYYAPEIGTRFRGVVDKYDKKNKFFKVLASRYEKKHGAEIYYNDMRVKAKKENDKIIVIPDPADVALAEQLRSKYADFAMEQAQNRVAETSTPSVAVDTNDAGF